MEPYFCQSLIKGPKSLELKSRLWNLLELLLKQKADSRTKGVVGNNGSGIPTTPNHKNIHPNTKYSFCINKL